MQETVTAHAAGTPGVPGPGTASGYALPVYPFVAPPDLDSATPRRYPVVIVGAGLGGLTLACALARLGIDAMLLDEDDTVGARGAASRGICYTQKSLEIFHRLGLYERIAARGVQWSVGRTFAGSDEIYHFDLHQQSGFQLSSQPAFINLQQFHVEGDLVERIRELGHTDLRWRSRVSAFEPGDAFATLTVDTPAGSYRLQAEHVIDACGADSPFHAWVGAALHGERGDDRWCIADVRLSWPLPAERHTWIEAPFNDGRAVWQHPLPDQIWRLDYQMPPDADPTTLSREEGLRARLRQQFGDDMQVDIVWAGPYIHRSQCLQALRVGRVFFLGDAAKVISPFGARAGNSAIADADNLAWKLAAVLRGRAAPALLDSYDRERLEAAQQNTRVTQRTMRFLHPAAGMEQTLRSAVIGLARRYPFARPLVNTGRMAVANSYTRSPLCAPTGGLSVPNAPFQWADGSPGVLNDLLHWADGDLLLLAFGDLSAEALERLRELASHAPVRAVQVIGPQERTQALEYVVDPNAQLQAACHVFGHAWALLRPDSYLAATGEAIDSELLAAIEASLALA